MYATFEHTIERADEDVYVEVRYFADGHHGDVDVEIEAVTLDGVNYPTTADEDKAILAAIFDRVDEDWLDEQAAYGDWLHDIRREANYPD